MATALTAGQTTTAVITVSAEPIGTDQEEARELDDQEDPVSPLASSSLSLDDVVAGTSASGHPPVDHHVHRDLLRRIARNMGLQAEQAIEPEDPIVDILTLEGSSRVALPLIKLYRTISKCCGRPWHRSCLR